MLFKLALRNSRRSRKENGLFFSALLVSVIAFYMILSLAKQDVMVFLSQVESVSVARILSMLPLFFGFTLVILFFLVYGAGRYQMERRSHEFGVCMMMGMSPRKLFALLIAENLGTSLAALAVGLPAGILCSEFTSLVVGRLVGLDLLDHTWAVSLGAVLGTALSFLGVNLGAALLLSGGTVRQEIGALLADRWETVHAASHPLRWGGLAWCWALPVWGLPIPGPFGDGRGAEFSPWGRPSCWACCPPFSSFMASGGWSPFWPIGPGPIVG